MRLLQPGPGRYIHGMQVLDTVGPIVTDLGIHTVTVVSGSKSYAAAGGVVTASLTRAQVRWRVVTYGGECSEEEVARISGHLLSKTDAVMGIGGGKVLDLAKIVADRASLPCVAIPTLISNCAATNPNTTVYYPDGRFRHSHLCKVPPRVTVVDDTRLRASPLRYFLSGLADTLVKPYEAKLAVADGAPWTSRLAYELALGGSQLIADRGADVVTRFATSGAIDGLSDFIDAVLLVGGMVGGIGGNAARTAAAHAVHNGLTEVAHAATLDTTHGEKVAYGLVVQETLLGREATTLRDLRRMLRRLGLPDSWRTLTHAEGGFPSRLQAALEDYLVRDGIMPTMPRVTASEVRQALVRVEAMTA